MAVNVWPAFVERYVEVLATYTTSLFFGSTRTQAKSLPRPWIRCSPLTRFQLAPASSERYTPPASPRASTSAYMRFPSLGAMPSPMPPNPPCAKVGSPLPMGFHVVPPSVDLNSPLFGPEKAPFSHGP